MKNHPYRSSSTAAALAAIVVTAALVGSLVESFEPAQLLQFSEKGGDQVVAVERRPQAPASDWT